MAKCFGQNDYKKSDGKWVDPLGPWKRTPDGQPIYAETGGPQARKAVFKEMNAQNRDFKGENALFRDAGLVGYNSFGDAQKHAQATVRGDYLNGSPQLDAAVAQMRASAGREAADASANIRDQFQRNGMSWGTANQQAQQSAQAAATAKANDTEAGARLQNYATERQNQMQGTDLLRGAYAAPTELLSQSQTARLANLAQMAQIIAGLAGNGQIVKPDLMQQLGIGDSFMKGAGYVL